MDTNAKTNYEEMYPEEFKSVLKANPIAFLPLGSMEYHGYHHVLGLDSLKAWKICQLAAKRIGGVVFPPLYLGVDAFPDIERLFRKIFESAYVETVNRIEGIQFHTAEERYRALIKEAPNVVKRVPLKHIASYLGITQVSLSRIRGIK